MKKSFYAGIILFLMFLICSHMVFAETDILSAKIVVYEDSIIKKVNRGLLGYNHNWIVSEVVVMSTATDSLDISEEYLDIMKGFPMPLNRMSGTVSQGFKWKWAIGSLEERKEQKLVGHDKMSKKRLGPIEWIKSVLLIDPAAKFTWTLNMVLDTPDDHADLAEFLTGDGKSNLNGGVDWAKKRIELGIKEPVNIVIWELGNELDWKQFGELFPTPDIYIEACKKTITAVKKVHPKAKFAAHAATAVHDKEYHKNRIYGAWEVWHREVLKQLNEQIDYIVFHKYYNGLPQSKGEESIDVIKEDILKITGNDKIKIYLSEHARWSNIGKSKSISWKDHWDKTHSLAGVICTAEWLNRMLMRKEVEMAGYHCFSGGPWALVYRDVNEEKLYTTGIFDLFKVLNDAYGENVVKYKISGEFTDTKEKECRLTTGIMTRADGLNIILTNRDPVIKRDIRFEFKDKYKLVKETIITAKDIKDYNTSDKKKIIATSKDINNEDIFNSYTMPAKSVVVLSLEKK